MAQEATYLKLEHALPSLERVLVWFTFDTVNNNIIIFNNNNNNNSNSIIINKLNI